MNNEELKKKIADIIYHTGCTGACCECDYSKVSDADTYCKALLKADALVAAGIGDVKTAQEIGVSATAMAVLEAAKAEHRAARAERALKKFAENISCEDCPFFSDCSSLEKMKDFVHPDYCFAEYLRQAEKELAEEGKDD